MKSNWTIAALFLMGSLASCSQEAPSSKSPIHSISVSSITADTSLSSKDKAEKLALAGEQLVTYTGFMYSEEILDLALELDPKNKRAQFYKAVLATPMKLKGILTRVKPLLKKYPESQNNYNEVLSSVPEGGLKTFLLDGNEDIKDESDVQGFMDEIYQGQDKLRRFLKDNKNTNLVLNLNDIGLIRQSEDEALKRCEVEKIGSETYAIKRCDMSRVMQVELTRADMESLQHLTAGFQIYSLMFNSYDLSGTVQVSQNIEEGDTTESVWNKLVENSAFGKIRNPKLIQNIPSLGIDLIAGVRWALSMQETLCSSGEGARKGILFPNGICLEDKLSDGRPVEDVLKLAELVLQGQTHITRFTDSQGSKQIEVNPAAAFNNPVKDLKNLIPEFNECGRISKIADPSFNGVLHYDEGQRIIEGMSVCPSEDELIE